MWLKFPKPKAIQGIISFVTSVYTVTIIFKHNMISNILQKAFKFDKKTQATLFLKVYHKISIKQSFNKIIRGFSTVCFVRENSMKMEIPYII